MLTEFGQHFAFGKNWASYARQIGEPEIAEAVAGLSRLSGAENIVGKRFIDIGCGSGLHSLAALRLGADEVVSVDLDPDSVATTRTVLSKFAPGARFRVEQASVFDLDPCVWGHFSVVYSWGVLHHTGDVYRALGCAARLLAPGGLFVFALYRRTWMCWMWKHLKRWYSKASPDAQAAARAIYLRPFALKLRASGRRLDDYVSGYRSNRGMDFDHDLHDWLGGYPYESVLPAEVDNAMCALGVSHVRSFVTTGSLLGRNSGVLGSGCDEFVYRRQSTNVASL